MSQPGGLGRFSRRLPSKAQNASGEATASSTDNNNNNNDFGNDPMDFSTTADTGVMDDSNSWMTYGNFDLRVSFDDGGPPLQNNDINLDMTVTTDTTTGNVDVSTMESFSYLDSSKTPETEMAMANNKVPPSSSPPNGGGLHNMVHKNVVPRDPPLPPPRACLTHSKTQDVSSTLDSTEKETGQEDTNHPSPVQMPVAFVDAPPLSTKKAPGVLPVSSDLFNKTQEDVTYTPTATGPNSKRNINHNSTGELSSLQQEGKDDANEEQPMEVDAPVPTNKDRHCMADSATFTSNVADIHATTTTTAAAQPSKGVAFLPAESFDTDNQDVRIIPGMTPMSNRRPPTVTVTVTPAANGNNMTSSAKNHQQAMQSSFAPRTPGPPPPLTKQQGGSIGNNSLHASTTTTTTATPQDSTHHARFASVVTPSDRQPTATSSALKPTTSRLLHAADMDIESQENKESAPIKISIAASPKESQDASAFASAAANILDDEQANWTFEDNYAQFLMDIRDLSDLQETNSSKLREMQGDFATAYAETLQDQAKLLDLVSQFEGIAVVTEELMRDVVSVTVDTGKA